jgi:cytochrome c biogenesis protein CcmG, thiol:disulfide interchange protein DsbE
MKKREGLRVQPRAGNVYSRGMKPWVKIALLVVVGVVAGRMLLGGGAGEGGALEGRPAPALRLPDLAGREVDLASLRGKVVAVNFWATWCPPCKEELPALAQAWRAGQGCLEILGVTEDSPRDDVVRDARQHAIPFPVLLDPDGAAARAFHVAGLPSTVLVDPEGRVRKVFTGPISRERLEAAAAPWLRPGCRRGG